MKRLTLLLFLSTLFICQLSAQVGDPRRDVAVGISGGYALNQVSFSPHVSQGMHGGMMMGVMVRYTCEKYFSMICAVQGELNYMQLGWKEDITTSTDTYSRNVNYLQMPLLVNIGFGRERGGVKGYIVAGPHLGYCIGDSEERGGEWSEESLSKRFRKEQYDKEIEKKFDYGITAGAGMDVSTRSGHHFTLEARFGLSLSNIFNSTKQDTFSRSANNTVTIKFAYLFDILKSKNISPRVKKAKKQPQ